VVAKRLFKQRRSLSGSSLADEDVHEYHWHVEVPNCARAPHNEAATVDSMRAFCRCLSEPRDSKAGSYALKVRCRIPFTFCEKAYSSPFAA
jgi:hypothetical protein